MVNRAHVNYLLGRMLLAGLLAIGVPYLQSAEKKTLEGTIADAMCGLEHKMAGASAAECTHMCVGKGSKYALVSGGAVYELEGKADDLKNFAGQKVKLSGTVDGKKIQVESVSKG